MQCKHEGCSIEVEGKAIYCSGRCRTAASRSVTDQPSTVTPTVTKASVTSPSVTSVTPTLRHYQDNPAMYAQRTNPTLINYGKPMSMHQLDKAGLKANRVAIPGDHDYSGCCGQAGDKWQVKGKD